MALPHVIPFGGGEIVGDSPERRVELLADHDALNATWSRFGPHREGADLHVHREHTDFFYVLEGELTVRLGLEDATVAVPPGNLVRVPPLVVHGFRNGSDGELRYLNLHAPGRQFADYLRAVRDGRSFAYDQYPPPEHGWRLPTEASIGASELVADAPGLRVAILADVDAIGISETRAEGGSAPPPHVHERHVESFYVLEGTLTFALDGEEHAAPAGTWVQVPAGVPHRFAFATGPVRFLNLHTPSCGYGDFLRGLHAARTDEERAAARAAFDQIPA